MTDRSFKISNLLKRLANVVLLILPSVIVGVSLLFRLNGDVFPPFHDGGNWLKMANALVGNTYPMWEQTTLQYPPLFNALLALTSIILGDALLAIKLLGLLVVALMPLAIYPLAREVSGSWITGLIAAWLMAFHPIFQEMYGWGGYPNAFGLLVLFGAIYFLIKIYHEKSMKYLIGCLVFSSLVVLSHHLTTIVFFAIALGWALFYLWMRFVRKTAIDNRAMLWIASCFAVSSVVFVLWRLAAGPFQYVVFNPSSLSVRPFDLEAFWWVFKSESVTTLLFLTSILGTAALFLRGKRVELSLLVMWVFLPLVFTQSYIFGIALDFKRLPIFSVPALAILSSCSFLLVQGRSVSSFAKRDTNSDLSKNKWNHGNPLFLKVDIWALLVIAVVGSLLCSVTLVGAATQQNVFVYYHHITDYTYSDGERLEALNWIKENTPLNAVIVADDALGRWIEGYASRRVVMRLPPYQAFMLSEVDRYKAADLLLHSNLEIRNEFVRLRDGTPYWTRQTPLFSISKGNEYKDLFYIVDAYNRVSFMFSGTRWVEAPYNPEKLLMNWVKNSSHVTMVMQFHCQSLLINKTLSLESGKDEATLRYSVVPVKPVELESMNVSLWIPPGVNAKVSWFEVLPVELEINEEPILLWLEPIPQHIELSPDPESGQLRVLFSYAPLNDEFDVTLRFAFPTAVKSTWSVGVEGLTSDEAIENYCVTHIAVGKRLYNMERLYQDPRFRQVHSNLKIAIFQVQASVEG